MARQECAQLGRYADPRFASEAVVPAMGASMDVDGWHTLRLAIRWSFHSPEDHRPLAENDMAALQFFVIISKNSAKPVHSATDICV